MPINLKEIPNMCFYDGKYNRNRIGAWNTMHDKRAMIGKPNQTGKKYKPFPFKCRTKHKHYVEWFLNEHKANIIELLKDGQARTVEEIITEIGETVCKAEIIMGFDYKIVRRFMSEIEAKIYPKNRLEKAGQYIDNYFYLPNMEIVV